MRPLAIAIALTLSVGTHVVAQSSTGGSPPITPFVVDTIDRGGSAIGFGFGSLWIAAGGRLSRVDAVDDTIVDIKLGEGSGPCRNVAVGEGAAWVPDCGLGVIYKIDPNSNQIVRKIEADLFSQEGSIGVGYGAVWAITTEDGERTLTRFNARTGEVQAKILLPSGSSDIAVAYGSVWVTGIAKGELYRVSPKDNVVTSTLSLEPTPRFVVPADGSLWILGEANGVLQQVDGQTGQLTAKIETGQAGWSHITSGGGYVWQHAKGALIQVDPHIHQVLRTYSTYGMAGPVCFGQGSLWLAGPQLYKVVLPNMPSNDARAVNRPTE
jgi:streptogramin lyase